MKLIAATYNDVLTMAIFFHRTVPQARSSREWMESCTQCSAFRNRSEKKYRPSRPNILIWLALFRCHNRGHERSRIG